jgi:hypothetical protein
MQAVLSPRQKFWYHRVRAEKAGIGFEFTFEQWWKFWQDSGHWDERGIGRGKYCMARFNDCGPYRIGNVRIITNEENGRELKNIMTPSRRKNISIALRRSEASKKYHARTSGKNHPISKDNPRSVSARKKISKSRMGDKNPAKLPVVRAKISATLTGRKRPLEECLKISASMTRLRAKQRAERLAKEKAILVD